MGREGPVRETEEHQVARGRQDAAPVGIVELLARLDFAGERIECLEAAVGARGRARLTAGEALARRHRPTLIDEVFLLDRGGDVATLLGGYEEDAQLGIVGRGLPVLAALDRRAQAIAFRSRARAVAARRILLYVFGRIVVEWPAGLGIEPRRPGQLVDVLLAGDE